MIERIGQNIEFYLSENYKNLDKKEKLEENHKKRKLN